MKKKNTLPYLQKRLIALQVKHGIAPDFIFLSKCPLFPTDYHWCFFSRPHVPLHKYTGRIACLVLIFLSIVLNISRFMEYQPKVSFSINCLKVRKYMCLYKRSRFFMGFYRFQKRKIWPDVCPTSTYVRSDVCHYDVGLGTFKKFRKKYILKQI